MNELKINQNSALANQIERIILFYNIDPDLFKRKLADRLMFTNIEEIQYKQNYLLKMIRAMIIEEKLENTANEKKDGVTLMDIVDNMRNLGIVVDPNEVYLMELYFDEARKYLQPKKIKEWVGAGIAYVLNSANKTSANFISLFKRTQTMKDLNLNHEEIEREYKKWI